MGNYNFSELVELIKVILYIPIFFVSNLKYLKWWEYEGKGIEGLFAFFYAMIFFVIVFCIVCLIIGGIELFSISKIITKINNDKKPTRLLNEFSFFKIIGVDFIWLVMTTILFVVSLSLPKTIYKYFLYTSIGLFAWCWIYYCISISKAFGKNILFTIGLIFLHPIFMLILAFGNNDYVLDLNKYCKEEDNKIKNKSEIEIIDFKDNSTQKNKQKRYCPNCRKELDDENTRVCSKCGSAVL